jgi:hypothetical protein
MGVIKSEWLNTVTRSHHQGNDCSPAVCAVTMNPALESMATLAQCSIERMGQVEDGIDEGAIEVEEQELKRRHRGLSSKGAEQSMPSSSLRWLANGPHDTRGFMPLRPPHEPLPIDPALPEIGAALRSHGAAVITAPPGAGKTTRVPPFLSLNGVVAAGQIVVLEPRRVAARAAARAWPSSRAGSWAN